MTIIYHIPQIYLMGGIERTTTAKINWLAKHGHKVILFLPEQGDRAPYFELDPSIKIYPFNFTVACNNMLERAFANQKLYRMMLKELSLIIKLEKPDIGICTDIDKLPILHKVMGKEKTLVEFHGAREAANKNNSTKDKLISYSCITRFIAYKLRIGRGWNRIAWRYYGNLIVLTQRDKNYWKKNTGVKNILSIPNPLPFTNPKQSSCTNKVVLAVGRFCDQKNFSDLLDIWHIVSQKNPHWTLKLVGNGEYEEDLKAQIDRLKLNDSVHLAPATLHIEPYYWGASIFCMTSRFEGLPMTLLEAQSMGLPIVSYNCPCGPDEIIEDGITGYITELGDKETFANKLLHLMENDELRIAMGRKAYEASHRYQIDTIMQTWTSLFEEICRKDKLS